MDVRAKRCDLCTRTEIDQQLDSWLGCYKFCGTNIVGPLQSVQKQAGDNDIREVCSFECLTKILIKEMDLTQIETPGETPGRLGVIPLTDSVK